MVNMISNVLMVLNLLNLFRDEGMASLLHEKENGQEVYGLRSGDRWKSC